MARPYFACTKTFKYSQGKDLYHYKMKYRNRLWILLGDLTEDAQVRCIEYDSQLMFTRKMFLDYILLKIHYTRNSSQQFMIRTGEDLDDVSLYLELRILWP